MAAEVIYVAGVPASGKTTIFKALRERLFCGSSEFKDGKVRGIESANKQFRMIGVFDGSTFEGTDRLSMTVIDDAIDYISNIDQTENVVVFVEGDRLFNYRFLSSTQAKIILIDASFAVLRQRHIERGDNQTEQFLRSRRTKIENFAAKYKISRTYNNTADDLERIVQFIIKTAESAVKSKN